MFDTGATYSECPAMTLKLLSEPIVETFSDNPLKENVTAVWEHIPFFGKTKCMKQQILQRTANGNRYDYLLNFPENQMFLKLGSLEPLPVCALTLPGNITNISTRLRSQTLDPLAPRLTSTNVLGRDVLLKLVTFRSHKPRGCPVEVTFEKRVVTPSSSPIQAARKLKRPLRIVQNVFGTGNGTG